MHILEEYKNDGEKSITKIPNSQGKLKKGKTINTDQIKCCLSAEQVKYNCYIPGCTKPPTCYDRYQWDIHTDDTMAEHKTKKRRHTTLYGSQKKTKD